MGRIDQDTLGIYEPTVKPPIPPPLVWVETKAEEGRASLTLSQTIQHGEMTTQRYAQFFSHWCCNWYELTMREEVGGYVRGEPIGPIWFYEVRCW